MPHLVSLMRKATSVRCACAIGGCIGVVCVCDDALSRWMMGLGKKMGQKLGEWPVST